MYWFCGKTHGEFGSVAQGELVDMDDVPEKTYNNACQLENGRRGGRFSRHEDFRRVRERGPVH